jgi:hypothetical protein
MTAATFDAALAAVRNVGDGPRLLEQANRIADRVEAENTELRRRIDTATAYVAALLCECMVADFVFGRAVVQRCDRCQALGILGGGT